MTEFFSCVSKAERIRCRAEDGGNHLLYNPRTDELHMLDARGKQVFDLCDGRSIDDVVRDACTILGETRPAEGHAAETSQQVLDFLCALKKRNLVVMS